MLFNMPHKVAFLLSLWCSGTHAQLQYAGINLAGAEFGTNIPGTHGADFTYPSETSVKYFSDKGFNVMRVPFRWERLQPTLKGDFEANELARLWNLIDSITNTYNKFAILDPHNYARYNDQIIEESAGVKNSDFEDLWTKLATQFKSNSKVIFGLMNEPREMDTAGWAASAKLAVAAIRATGATQLILVPGNGWTGAHSWEQNWYDSNANKVSNAQVFEGFTDSNFAFELHQYFDSDYSGRVASCTKPESLKGSEVLTQVTAWLKARGYKGFLGEFAGGDNPDCKTMLTDTLNYMATNSDVWIGYTWWAAGGAWPIDYIFNLEPINGADRGQTSILTSFLSGKTPETAPPSNGGTTGGTNSAASTRLSSFCIAVLLSSMAFL